LLDSRLQQFLSGWNTWHVVVFVCVVASGSLEVAMPPTDAAHGRSHVIQAGDSAGYMLPLPYAD